MTILVTGATGTVGRNVVKYLIENGQHVRALSRNPEKASFPAGVEVVTGDLAATETLAAAMDGITGLHLINFDGGTGEHLHNGRQIIDLAIKAGVRRVTVLQGGEKGSVEEAVEASDLEWTYIQPVEFMSNMLEWADSIRAEGVVRAPYADRRTAIVHEADIGAVAGAVLIAGGYGGQALPVTGPEVLTPRLLVDTLGAAIGRNITLIELSESEAREQWQAAGFPEAVIEFFVWALGNTPAVGYTVAPTVEQVTGRPARTFAQWATEHAHLFKA